MKEIKLTNVDLFCIVDDEDFDKLKIFNWQLSWNGYAISRTGPRGTKNRRMHRIVIEAAEGQFVDHINRNKLDNRKENLRFANHSENKGNIEKYRGKHKYKGIWFNKHVGYWYAKCAEFHCGHYNTAEEAAIAYNRKAIEHFGEFALLNEIIENK